MMSFSNEESHMNGGSPAHTAANNSPNAISGENFPLAGALSGSSVQPPPAVGVVALWALPPSDVAAAVAEAFVAAIAPPALSAGTEPGQVGLFWS